MVVLGEVAVDGGLQLDDGAEHAALQPPPGERREERLDRVEPGAGGRREVEGPARVAGQPGTGLGVLVGSIVVEDHVNDLAGRDLALDRIQEADELLVAVARHAASDHPAVEDVEGGEQRGRAVALVVVRPGARFAGLQRQAGLGAIERLDLALLVEREDQTVGGRIDVQPDDVAQLLGERRVVRALEGAQAVRLEVVLGPDPLLMARPGQGETACFRGNWP